MGSVDLQ